MIFHLKAKDYISDITGCGYSRFVSGRDKCQFHDHDFYEFVLILEGNAVHECNGNTGKLFKNSLMLIRPHDIHRFKAADGNFFSYVNLAFSQHTFESVLDFLDASDYFEILAQSSEPLVVEITREQARSIGNSFMKLIGDTGLTEPLAYSRGLIASVFSKYFINKIQEKPETQIPQWFIDLCEQMEKIENFSEGAEIMRCLSGKSYGYIGHCFRNYLGISPTEYVNNIRLEYASKMLTNSNMPIIDISNEIGYNNLGYFYRSFKKKYGLSPSKYREEEKKHIVL